MGRTEKRKSILLVEDEALIALAEKQTLTRAGYEIFHVSSGEQAVAFVRRSKPAVDLILMDIDLGSGIDGTDAATGILRLRTVPIVFLSSHTEQEYVARTEQVTSYGNRFAPRSNRNGNGSTDGKYGSKPSASR